MGRALVHEMYLRVKNALMNVLLITEGWSSVFRMMCLTLSSTQFPSRWTSSDWWHACSSPHQTQWVPDACVSATFHNSTIDFNSLILSLILYFTHSQVWVTIESTYYSSHKTHLHHYLFESVPFLLTCVPNSISIVYLMLLPASLLISLHSTNNLVYHQKRVVWLFSLRTRFFLQLYSEPFK